MPLSYASTSTVRAALRISTLASGAADTTDDAILDRYVSEANTWLEGRIGFPVGPSETSTTRYFDGRHVSRDGSTLWVPEGIRSVNAISVADSTGAAYRSLASSDWVLRPYTWERPVGAPASSIELSDSPSGQYGSTVLPRSGLRVIQVQGSWGWDSIPSDLSELAVRLSVAAFRAGAYGTGETYTVGEDGSRVFEREMSSRDWGTVNRYRHMRATVH